MDKSYFKYEIRRGGGSIFTTANLDWFDKLMYWLKGYEVIKLN